MVQLTWSAALAWRLRRQYLEPLGTTSVVDVVDALVAVAAQPLDPAAAALGVRTRLVASAADDLARAEAEGPLVRTFAFRGAVHLMTPRHAAAHLALRASSRMWERRSWREYYALEPRDWPPLLDAVREALDAGPLTRHELAAAVTSRTAFRHLGHAFTDPQATFLKALAWQGALSLGTPRGGGLTLRRLDTVPGWPGTPDLDAAGHHAVRAYVHAYGPVSPAQVTTWIGDGLGVRRALVDRWLDELRDEIARIDVEGETLLVRADDVDDLADAAPSDAVRLLPQYDQWVLGPGTSDPHVVPPDLRAVVSRGARLATVGGVVAGTWRLADATVVLEWRPGARPSDDLVDAEVERLTGLLGRELRIDGPAGR